MGNVSVTLSGINMVVDNLDYRPGTVKYKAVQALLSFYTSEESLGELHSIDTDTLIAQIWDVGNDPYKIRSKRRNFSSLRSSINSDLKKLVKKDLNPESIILSDTNIFDMTEEAKTSLLNSFTDAVKTGDIDLAKATDILRAVTEFLNEIDISATQNESIDIINEIKKVLSRLGGHIFDEQGQDIETIEVDEDTESEEIEEIEEIELDEDEPLEEVQDIVLDEDQDIEEVELEEDELLEEIDGDILEEEPADEDIEQIELDDDQDIEEIELDEDEPLGDVQDIVLDEDQDIEEVELEEDELLEEIDGDILEEEPADEDIEQIELDDDQDIETLELDEDEPLGDVQDIVLDEDQDIEEVELEEDERLEEIDGDILEEEPADEDIEQIELDDDQDIETLELDEDEELEEIDELDEEELKALEAFREARELAEHFDATLGEREKKFNAYVKIPKGIYTIGTQKALKSSLELQQFEMPLVYMGKYPVTNALFEIFIEETGYLTTAEKKGYGVVYHSRYQKKENTASWNKQAGSKDVKGACWHQPMGPGSTLHEKRNHPVVQISVEDAIAYASWIGRRLPTEAEWEAAARTDLGFKYPWGNQFDPKALNIEQTGRSDTSPVETYDAHANEFGMTDMLGNVMEWTSDRQWPPFKTRGRLQYNVAKGVAWNGPDTVTISSRGLYKPDFTANTIGFRCISELFQ